MTIIKVPSCWMIWIPGNKSRPATWINLANADKIEVSDDEQQMTVHMASKAIYHFQRERAESILKVLKGEFVKVRD